MGKNFVTRIVVIFLLLQVGPRLPLPLWGQETGAIVGKVTPAHEHGGFILATARIPDLALKTTVDADGSFRFDGVRPGTYLLEVRVPSLGVALETVTVRAGEEVSVEVPLTAGSHFEEIVVTASADARDPLNLATASASLSGQELALRLESSLGETLAQEAGISSTFFGPGASRPVIRGLAGDRVRMLEGGLGTGDASSVSADHAVTTDPAQAERIEVLRGPATLLYGSSAVGGVVNVIDERIPSSRATSPVGGTVDLRFGTVSDERMGALNANGGSGDWAWHFDIVARQAEAYEIPGFAFRDDPGPDNPLGVVPNTDLETEGARLGATRFFGTRGFLGVAVGGFASNYGLPGGLGHSEAEGLDLELEEEETVRIDLEQRRFDLQGEVKDPFGTGGWFQGLKVRIGGTDYEHVELEGDEEGTLFFNDFVETRVELVQRRRGRLGGSSGVQYLDREFEAVGAEAFLPKTRMDRWALFTFQEVQAGPLAWQFGARYESQNTEPDLSLPARSHAGLSASLGLVWDLDADWSIAASVARSVKLPAPEELYSEGAHVAAQAFEIGDPGLTEESGLGIDLSLRFEREKMSGELTLFRQDFSDFIFQAFTGGIEDGFPVLIYRQADAEFVGAEFKARVELLEKAGHHLHLEVVGDLVEADLDAGQNLPRIPPRRLGAGLHYHSERWNATTEIRWVDDQTAIAPNETFTEGYTLVNASVGYRFLFRNQILDLLLRGRNLTDQEARNHTSLLKDVAPLPGRDLSLALKLYF